MPSPYLLVGLGNPGYDGTRHNAGFMVIDGLVDEKNGVFKKSKFGQMAALEEEGCRFYCLKPNTFMNKSGEAIS